MKSVGVRRQPSGEGATTNGQVADILRSIAARAEDTAQLLTVSEKNSGKLKCATLFAEKLVAESELKEDWRIAREDGVMIGLSTMCVETPAQKRSDVDSYLEKSVRKVLNLILKFSPLPSEHELNSSEMHVDNVMNTKVSPQSTIIEVDRSGKRVIRILNSTPEGWKKTMWKEARIMEACLYGESVNVGLVLSTCLKMSRKTFTKEIAFVRECVEGCDLRVLQSLSSPPPVSKHSQSSIFPLHKSPNTHRSVIRNSVSLLDWKAKMLEMLLDLNKDSKKAVTSFLRDYRSRQIAPKAPSERVKQVKTDRAKLYETYGAVSPYQTPEENDVAQLEVHLMDLVVLKGLGNEYFDGTSLEYRIKVVHCVKVIQEKYREIRSNRTFKTAHTIQQWLRMVLAKAVVENIKLNRFRAVYYQGRLRHWLKLLAGKWRMRKQSRLSMDLSRYLSRVPTLLCIQKLVRGFLVRRIEVPHLRSLRSIRFAHSLKRIQVLKASLWRETRSFDDNIIKNALAVAEQLQYFHQTLQQGRKIKGFKTDKDLSAYIRSMEKAEARDRKHQTLALAEVRIKALK